MLLYSFTYFLMEAFLLQLLNKNKNKNKRCSFFAFFLCFLLTLLYILAPFLKHFTFSPIFLIPEEFLLSIAWMHSSLNPNFSLPPFLYSLLFLVQVKILLIAYFILLCLNNYYPPYNAWDWVLHSQKEYIIWSQMIWIETWPNLLS